MDEIKLTAPDPAWPDLFQAEKVQLVWLLASESLVAIEHFGSTSIPNLIAKPIIDILIEVPDIEIAKKRFPPLLDKAGYKYWADNPKTDRMFFVKGMPPFGERRTHHIHVEQAKEDVSDRLKLRDFLRNNAAKTQEYAELKKRLAERYADDREAYTEAKSTFVASIMAKIAAQSDR